MDNVFVSVAAATGALAWTSVVDDALAGTERPAARGLAGTSIQVGASLRGGHDYAAIALK